MPTRAKMIPLQAAHTYLAAHTSFINILNSVFFESWLILEKKHSLYSFTFY